MDRLDLADEKLKNVLICLFDDPSDQSRKTFLLILDKVFDQASETRKELKECETRVMKIREENDDLRKKLVQEVIRSLGRL